MRLVEDVMSCIYATPTLTPDVLLERLRPLMSTGNYYDFCPFCV